MKRLNAKGFTLIELLAVITIMGILMMVAIPTVSRTIENSRKDTFLDTAKQYINGAKNMWAADNLSCQVTEGGTAKQYLSSAVPTGTYYINIDTTSSNYPVLLEQGGKSSWGSRDIKGYIEVKVEEVGSAGKVTRKVSYRPILVDGIHGVNVGPNASGTMVVTASPKTGDELVRGDIQMTGAVYTLITAKSGNNVCIEV